MFNDKEQTTGLGGVTVQDAWVGLQLLDKSAGSGVIQPTEYAVLSQWRANLVDAIQRAIGKNFDEEAAKARQAQMAAQQQAQQATAESLSQAAPDTPKPATKPATKPKSKK